MKKKIRVEQFNYSLHPPDPFDSERTSQSFVFFSGATKVLIRSFVEVSFCMTIGLPLDLNLL